MYGTPSRFNNSFLRSCWIRELILSLRSSSPSPSVILPLRSRIVTPLTIRSSICIASPSNPRRVEWRRSDGPSRPPAGAARIPNSYKKDRSAYYALRRSVKNASSFTVGRRPPMRSDITTTPSSSASSLLGRGRFRRPSPGQPAKRLHDDIKDRDEQQVQEGG